MNENFAVDKKILNLIKQDELSGLILCYVTANSNIANYCRFTLKQIIKEHGYSTKNGSNQNTINNKIKNSLRLLISKEYITLIPSPYNNKPIKDFEHITINDEIWVEIKEVNNTFILLNREKYLKILVYCFQNKQYKSAMAINIYLYIISHINMQEENGKCSVGYNNFTTDLNMSKTSVSKYTDMLINIDLLFKKKGNTIFTNEYYLKPLKVKK